MHTTTCVLSPLATRPATVTTAVPTLWPNDPHAIYQRYKEAQEAWYATLDRGAVKTNQQYRKAKKLPARYSKTEYSWCLDWDKAENKRVEHNIGIKMAEQPFSGRRGMRDIWDAAERDLELQEELYRGGNPPTNICNSNRKCDCYTSLERERKVKSLSIVIVIQWLDLIELWLSCNVELNRLSSCQFEKRESYQS